MASVPKPVLVIGTYRAFQEYSRSHPNEWCVHVSRLDHVLDWEVKEVVMVGPYRSGDQALYNEAKTRIR